MDDQLSGFAVQPILCTTDIGRMRSFYATLFGAEERVLAPGDGGPFFVELRFGAARLGLVNHTPGAAAAPGPGGRAVLVESVDDLWPRVEPAGGKVGGPANDMPWGHRGAHIT